MAIKNFWKFFYWQFQVAAFSTNALTSLKIHGSYPTAIGTTFNVKFVLDAKVQNKAFWNTWNLGFCCNSVEFTEDVNSRGLGLVRNKNMFPQTILDKRL